MVEERAKASRGTSPIYHTASHGSAGQIERTPFRAKSRGAKLGEGKDNRKWNCEVRNELRWRLNRRCLTRVPKTWLKQPDARGRVVVESRLFSAGFSQVQRLVLYVTLDLSKLGGIQRRCRTRRTARLRDLNDV
jgi:hypothetical protein